DLVAGNLEVGGAGPDRDGEAASQSVNEVVADDGAGDWGGLRDTKARTSARGDRKATDGDVRSADGEGIAASRLNNRLERAVGRTANPRIASILGADQRQRLVHRYAFGIGTREDANRMAVGGRVDARLDGVEGIEPEGDGAQSGADAVRVCEPAGRAPVVVDEGIGGGAERIDHVEVGGGRAWPPG